MKVFIVAAMTADGFIGKGSDHLATEWTNKDDQKVFTQLVKPANNMVMGRNTFFTTARKYKSVFTKSMPGRRLFVYTPDPAELADYPEVEAVSEPPAELVKRLSGEGLQQLAICGGTQIYTMFMAAGVVDDIYIDVQATVFGAGQGLFNAPLQANVTLENIERLGDNNVLLQYRVQK